MGHVDQIPLVPPTERQQSLWDQVETSQQILSSQLHLLSHRLDSFFGAPRVDEESTSPSRIRINLLSSFRDYSGDSYGINIRTRIALPHTEKKLNLVLQNLTRDFTEDRESDKPTLGKTVQNETYAAGLRFLHSFSKAWNVGLDTGVKLTLPLDPYARLRIRRSWWPKDWEIRATEVPYWFQSQGFGHTESLTFDRQLSDRILFRFDNNFSWKRADPIYFFDHSLNLMQKWSDSWGFHYFFSSTGNDDPQPHVEEYTLGINFRKQIRAPWLFFNILPAGHWPRTQHFSFVSSIDFKLEIIIGE